MLYDVFAFLSDCHLCKSKVVTVRCEGGNDAISLREIVPQKHHWNLSRWERLDMGCCEGGTPLILDQPYAFLLDGRLGNKIYGEHKVCIVSLACGLDRILVKV